MTEKPNNKIKRIKKKFWTTYGIFLGIVALLILTYLVLSSLNFFG
ncbi:MAG: hypothetical protein ACTH80_07790 [Alkalibacterium gilvum]|nr:hypothetical protein [Alkalibacterium sp.]